MKQLLQLAIYSGMVAVLAVVFIMPSHPAKAFSASQQGARDFATWWCANSPYGENAIADYMWITNPKGGGLSFDVVEGQSQLVDVTVNFFVTYCTEWPNDNTAYGYNLGVSRPAGANLLRNAAATIDYGDRTNYGSREEWGVNQTSAQLDLTGLPSGSYNMCTSFASYSFYAAVSPPSDSACFTVNVNRIYPWTTSAESKVGVDYTPPNVSSWTAQPNQMLYWRHTISASGGTTPGLDYAIGKTGFFGANVWGDGSAANHNKPVGTTSAIGAGSSYSVGWGVNRPEYSTYRVMPSDGGRTLCQGISWGPTAWNNAAWTASAPACVTVPFNYNLLPSVTGPSGVGVVGGPIATITPRVNNQVAGNASATTDSPPVEWQLKRIEVPPTIPDPNAIPLTQQENGNAPCTHYGNGGVNDCIAKGEGTRTFPAGNANPALAALNGEVINADTPVGTRICYTLSVRPYSQANGDWRHSAPICIKVSKQPKMQVWGHDVRTRGSIKMGSTMINDAGTNKLFGSWVEYGGFSVGVNGSFASAAGLNNGTTNTAASSWNNLTFANIDNSGSSSYGMYTLDALPKITDQFIGASSGGAFNSNLGILNSGTYNVGSVTIDASAVGQAAGLGKSIIIVASGTVTITGDVTYTGVAGDTFTAINQIPQVVIIARNINITGAVGRVDAWLLTTLTGGAINTCSDRAVDAPLNSAVCSNILTVNGPVATEHLYLRRTAGSDSVAAAGSPAEVFNLRPDAYLWAYGRASQVGKAQTVDSIELPPRF